MAFRQDVEIDRHFKMVFGLDGGTSGHLEIPDCLCARRLAEAFGNSGRNGKCRTAELRRYRALIRPSDPAG